MLLMLWILVAPIFEFNIHNTIVFIATIIFNCIYFWIVYSHNVELRDMEIPDISVASMENIWCHF